MRLILNALIPLVFLPTLCLAQVLQYDAAGRPPQCRRERATPLFGT